MNKEKVVLKIDEGGTATVTLNNPQKNNAFDDTIIEDLTRVFKQIDSNNDVRVMILTATGKNFCAGGDLGWMKRMADYTLEENLDDARLLAAMLKTLNFLSVPTIAKVQGVAFGGGVGLVSCCDMAVAATDASFCLSEVKIGLIPATISPYVISAMGQRASRRYFTTAERFSAQTALKQGLVSEVVDKQHLDDEVTKLVNALLGNSPAAIRAAKQLVFQVASRDINDELIDFTSKQIANIRVSTEGQEGLTTFLEKRKPAWSVS